MHFYADAITRELLMSTEPKVLLYGGFEGFDNFGDILQVQGAIDFHRERTGRTPIMVLSMSAWTHTGLLDELRTTYGIQGFIFEDGELLDGIEFELEPIHEIQAGSLLHIYGGGYFNEYWGARRAFVCEQIIFHLHVVDYVVSGIQVDPVGAEHLKTLFKLKAPLIVGARDERSVALLADFVPTERLFFSFDDAVEVIESLNRRMAKIGAVGATPLRSVGLHVNLTSEYMAASQGQNARDIVNVVADRFPDHNVTLLHAYNDQRHLVRDTLESFRDVCPESMLIQFDAINFASLATHPAMSLPALRRLMIALERIDFVVTASYHIALTLNLLGKPTYLIASSGFYHDKRAALGLATDVDAFLAQPRTFLRNFSSERRERRSWLDRLTTAIDVAMSHGWNQPVQLDKPQDAASVTVASRYLES